MSDELERLCAERDALIAETERLEGGHPERLREARARLAEVLHRINDVSDGVPAL